MWDFSGQMTQSVVDGENCPNDCLGQATEEVISCYTDATVILMNMMINITLMVFGFQFS